MPDNRTTFPDAARFLRDPAPAAMARFPFSIAALTLSLFLVACGRDQSADPSSAATPKSADENPLLRYVPADTPFFVVSQRRIPKAVALAHAARSTYSRAELLGMLQRAAEAEQEASAQRTVAILIRLVELLPERFDEAGFASLGLRPDGHIALYGVGLLPVLRMELGNRKVFQDLLDRVFAALEVTPQRERRGDRDWIHTARPPLSFHLLVGDTDVALTLAPVDMPAEQLERLLGDRLPERHLGQSGRLEELTRRHRFLPYQLGRFDTAAILTELAQPALAVGRIEPAQAVLERPECKQDFDSLARRYPGIDFGMRRFDEKNAEVTIVFRTEPALAADLGKLAAPLPKLPPPLPLFDLAFGLRAHELAALLGRWAQALDQAPYRCEALKALNDLAGTFRTAATNPATAMAGSAGEGAMVRLDRLNLANLNAPDFAATIVLVSPNPQGTVGLLAGLMPEIAGLGLVVGGEPVAVPAELLGPPIRSAFAGLGERSAVVALNHADAAAVKAVLAAPADTRQRVFLVEFSGSLLAILADALRRASEAGGGADPELAIQAAQLEHYAREVVSGSLAVQIGVEGVELVVVASYR